MFLGHGFSIERIPGCYDRYSEITFDGSEVKIRMPIATFIAWQKMDDLKDG